MLADSKRTCFRAQYHCREIVFDQRSYLLHQYPLSELHWQFFPSTWFFSLCGEALWVVRLSIPSAAPNLQYALFARLSLSAPHTSVQFVSTEVHGYSVPIWQQFPISLMFVSLLDIDEFIGFEVICSQLCLPESTISMFHKQTGSAEDNMVIQLLRRNKRYQRDLACFLGNLAVVMSVLRMIYEPELWHSACL